MISLCGGLLVAARLFSFFKLDCFLALVCYICLTGGLMCDCCCREVPVRSLKDGDVEAGVFCSDCVPPMEEVLTGPFSVFSYPFDFGEG